MSQTLNEFSSAAKGVLVLSLLFALKAAGLAAVFSEWQHQQKLTVPSVGVLRIALPAETLDAALSNLADLRVVDPAGNEAPYLLNQPVATPETFIAPKKFESSLNAQTTVLSIETGVSLPLAEVLLATPEASFIKPVRIEGSNDGNRWQTLAEGRPIFRQPNGANQLRLALTPASWAYLRITIDDGRSRAIPFTGVTLRVQGEPAPVESVPVQIRERADVPGQTRLTLDFGAAHLFLTNVRLETPDTLFARQVTLVTQEMEDNVIIERPLGRGTIFRVEIEGQPPVAQLDFPIHVISPGRELLLLIQNDDNPPLAITGIRAERRPVFLIFRATQAGEYSVLSGNKKGIAPRYDLGALGGNLKNVPISPLRLSGIVANPTYQPGEALPGIAMGGAALDVSDWRFRKAVTVSRSGVQRLELDLEILSQAQPNFADLRLMRDGKQVPIILERTSLTHPIPFKSGFADDPKSPTLSRWVLKMSQSNLPLTKFTCRAKATLFKRHVLLYEEFRNDRGEISKRTLGEAQWVNLPDAPSQELVLAISSQPAGDTVVLQIDNGDNPAVELEDLHVFYPVSRILFKASEGDSFDLYYGNSRVGPPNYDLNLVAGQMLAAEKNTAQAGAEERVKRGGTFARVLTGRAGLVFWVVLGLVVVGLLAVISRLLPKTGADKPGNPETK